MGIWTKIAVLIVIIVGVIIAIQYFGGSKPEDAAEPQEQVEPKSFYEVAEDDSKRFLTEPEPSEFSDEQPQPKQQLEEEPQPVEAKPSGPVTIYCKELSEIDDIEAERLLNVAVPGRSIGRLPMTGFNLMVDTCRQIIQRWPDSWYAYRAKQMLADMPPRFRPRYKITEEELDLSKFLQPREGTKPYIVEETD